MRFTAAARTVGTLACGAVLATSLQAQNSLTPTRSVTDPGVVTTRQAITPAGVQTVFDGKVYGVTFGATSAEIWVLVQSRSGPAVYQLDWRDNHVAAQWQFQGTAALQGLAFDRARQSPLVGISLPTPEGGRRGGRVQLLQRDGPRFVPLADGLGEYLAGSPAIAGVADTQRAILPLVHDDAIAVVNARTGAVLPRIKTDGVAPFASAISRDGAVAPRIQCS